MSAEQHKLIAEALKFEPERALYPAAVGVIGALVGSVATTLARVLK